MKRRVLNIILIAEVLAIAVLVVLLAALVFGLTWREIDYWAERYQTLIAGLLALLGAAMTVWFLREQIEQNRKHADRQHRHAMRVANVPSLKAIDSLTRKLSRMI